MPSGEDLGKVTELHERAMSRIDQARAEKMGGERARYAARMKEAFELEREAAQIAVELELEPSRSVLLRSAAWLALESGELSEARRLASLGLSGDPPPETAVELREVIVQVSGDREIDPNRIVFDSFRPAVQRLFVGYGFPRPEVSRLVRNTFQKVLREKESPGLTDLMDEALRLAQNCKRLRWAESRLRTIPTSEVEDMADFDSPQPRRPAGALDQLPAQMRQCVLMRQRGLGYPAIARALRTSIEVAEDLWDQAQERLAEAGLIEFSIRREGPADETRSVE